MFVSGVYICVILIGCTKRTSSCFGGIFKKKDTLLSFNQVVFESGVHFNFQVSPSLESMDQCS